MTAHAFANQSGGSVKTTTATAIAVTLAVKHKRRVRLIDADDQRDASHVLGYTEPDELEDQANFADVLAGDATLAEASVPALYRIDDEWREIPNLTLVPGSKQLVSAESFLTDPTDRMYRVQDALEEEDDAEVTTLFDCPGSLNIVTVNILMAVQSVTACIKPGTKEIRALTELEATMDKANKRRKDNPVSLSSVIIGDMPPKSHGHAYHDAADMAVEMYGSRVLTWVARSVKVGEAYDAQCALPFYAPEERVTTDYAAATEQMIKMGIF